MINHLGHFDDVLTFESLECTSLKVSCMILPDVIGVLIRSKSYMNTNTNK